MCDFCEKMKPIMRTTFQQRMKEFVFGNLVEELVENGY